MEKNVQDIEKMIDKMHDNFNFVATKAQRLVRLVEDVKNYCGNTAKDNSVEVLVVKKEILSIINEHLKVIGED